MDNVFIYLTVEKETKNQEIVFWNILVIKEFM